MESESTSTGVVTTSPRWSDRWPEVSLVEDRVVLWRQVHQLDVAGFDAGFGRWLELVRDLPSYVIVCESSASRWPDAALRARIKECARRDYRGLHLAVAIDGNSLMVLALRFVLARIGIDAFSVHRRLEDAIAEARRALP
ncbi:MAG: hypothetical protein EXR73_10205 [Myxococcales bacterium]|nr:hypothetical protein [Myxococcales bacterium]